ncbi:MAG TPA: arsenate reductase ArsC [Crenotrichaceae bacterium]|nr:arsenate reductase ArsC [Crenotrichaceae bacterium]
MKNVLVLCTGNSCRSVMAEALFKQLGKERINVFSAGSHPIGRINAGALKTLERHGLPTESYRSKSWDEFDNQPMDIVITVCDNAAGETCPVYLNKAVRVHWGVSDPGHVEGTEQEIETAFENTFATLKQRIKAMLELPIEQLSDTELSEKLNKIRVIHPESDGETS